jgi:hypothetical protein
MSLSRTGRLNPPPRDARPIGSATETASSNCWAGAESWASLTANGVGGVYAASLMPQTSCHAWNARVGAVVGCSHAVAGQKKEIVDLVLSPTSGCFSE